jgi:aldehyde oxidoreductase
MLHINGMPKAVIAEPDTMLAEVLREQLNLTGTKVGCGQGQCGCCSVIVNGKVVRSCITKMKRVEEGARVTTIEGSAPPTTCTPFSWPGPSTAAPSAASAPRASSSRPRLFWMKTKPTRQEVRDWFQKHRNACRCTGYKPLVDAVMDAAKVVRGEMTMKDLAFKLPADGRIWGTAYPRPTAVAKVTGTIDYGADLGVKMPPGTLRLALVQAKVSHAKILSIDTSEPRRCPGSQRWSPTRTSRARTGSRA